MKTKKWSSILICWAKKEMGKYASHTPSYAATEYATTGIDHKFLFVCLSIYLSIMI